MKERFPIFTHHPGLVYLDSAATAHKPCEVIEALTQFYSSEYGTVHRAIYQLARTASEKYHAAREKVASFLGATVDEIIFTRGTTDSINLVSQSLGKSLTPDDEILITEMEHHSNIVPWQMLAEKTGARLRWILSDERGVLQWQGQITPQTKVVALAHISNVTGTIHPIREIVDEAHRMGALVLVDGAQAAPCMPVDVQKLGCDFYAFSGHKCYGPTGIGVLYGKKDLLAQMAPIDGGGDMIQKVSLDHSTYQEAPLRFEAGTPIIGSVIGLKAALDFLDEVGRETIFAHGQALLSQATEGLSQIAGLKIIGTAPQKGPILTFQIEGVHPLDLATLLDLEKIAVRSGNLCAQPILRKFGCEAACRASFGIYNTEKDVEAFVIALQKILPRLRS